MNQISKVSFKHSVTLYLLVSEQYVFDKEMLKGCVNGHCTQTIPQEKKIRKSRVKFDS